MKNFLLWLCLITGLTLPFYLLGAWIELSFNPQYWEQDLRIVLGLFWTIISIFASLIYWMAGET